MTTHKFAKLLLENPDLPFVIMDTDRGEYNTVAGLNQITLNAPYDRLDYRVVEKPLLVIEPERLY